jgi:signal transducing adaptor molecule
MEDLYDDLKRKGKGAAAPGPIEANQRCPGYKFEQTSEPLPPSVDDEVRRKEEEELQRVLELSMKDTGGRGTWSQYSLAATSTGGAGGSSSSAAAGGSSSAAAATGGGGGVYGAPKYQAGYVPARTPSPATQRRYNNSPPPPAAQAQPQPPVHQQSQYNQPPAQPAPAPSYSGPSTTSSYTPTVASTAPTLPTPSVVNESAPSPTSTSGIITRVRALHTFEPSEPGELAFDKGDIIKVVDRGYKDWWRGQLKGRTGIFPVNYVEPMPEPSKEELWKEAEAEAVVFGQAVNVEKLLAMLKNWDVERESLADNEEIQVCFFRCPRV